MLSGAALAESVTEKTGVNSALGISPTTQDFVTEAATSDMLEIQAGKIAQERGTAAEKTFAGEMVADHTKTSEHIKELVASSLPRFKGLGHLFQGAIDLEASGVAGAPGEGADGPPTPAPQPKLRVSALNHLKEAFLILKTFMFPMSSRSLSRIRTISSGLLKKVIVHDRRTSPGGRFRADPTSQLMGLPAISR